MKRQVLISSLILLFIQTLASAGVLYVPSRDYPTIQSAINVANPLTNDVVVVAPGTWTGHGNVDLDFKGKAITVRSEINPDNPEPGIIAATIIDCQGTRYNPHRAFRFHSGEGPDSRVLGFTIINGYAQGPAAAPGQPGYDGYPVGLFDPINPDEPDDSPPRALPGAGATGNGYGGAILCEGASSPTIQYCVISNCTVTGAQGGDGAPGLGGPWEHWTIADVDPCTGEIDDVNNLPTENDDGQWGGHGGFGSGNGYGGAISCRAGSSPIISDCTIKDNFATGGRGGNGGNGGNATEFPDYDEGLESGSGTAGDSIGDGMGGGIYAENGSSPDVTNCTFSNNVAATGIRGTGGQRGLGNTYDDPPQPLDGFDSLVIPAGHIAGGAAYYTSSNPNFTNCTFTGNKAYEAYTFYYSALGEDISRYTIGGALYSDVSNIVTLDNCKFIGNLGGAVYCENGCNLNFDDCSFTDNSEIANGGALYIDSGCTVDLQGCIFGGNSAYDDGGALKCRSNANLTNCSFGNNVADSDNDGYGYGGAMDAYQPGTTLIIDVNNCSFSGNQSIYGGGFSSENFDATFTDCYFIGNTAQEGGGLDLVNGDVSVTGGVVKGNNATDGDGGGFNCSYSIAEIRDCTISDNFADGIYPTGGNGGAINFYGGATTQEVFNCLITGNSATIDGGAIFCHSATPEIGNCTFSDNLAGGYGGAIFSDWASDPQITDSIFQNNNSHAIYEQNFGGDALVIYSLFYDNPYGDYYDSGTGLTYTGAGEIGNIPGGVFNLYGDPLFLSGPLGGFYLNQTSSPAVDNGSDTAVSLGLDSYTTDAANALDSGQVDIGYHYIDIADVDTFQLTTSVIGGQGTIGPETGSYYAGTVVTLTATPGAGWRIKAWSGTDDDSSTAETSSVVMNSDRTVTVEFDQPRTLIVAVGGGGGYYSNITDALHDAEDGDTIVVYAGTYYGPQVQVNKDVEIRSMHPDDPNWVAQTIIDSTSHAGPVFWFDPARGPGCILNGFTIQNSTWYTTTGDDGEDPGENGEDGPGAAGGAIYIYSGASPVIKNCVIRDNFILGGFGGTGVDADETHNAGRGGWGGWARGGAIYCGTNSSPAFINCQIIDNQAVGGIGGNGGDWDPEGGSANYGGNWSRAEWWNRLTGSLVLEWVEGDLWEVWQTTIITTAGQYIVGPPYIGDYRWYSGYGGGVYCDTGSTVTFIHCTISGNLAQGGLSGLGGFEPGAGPQRAKPFPLQYEIPSFGGGVYCAADTTVTFNECTITDNVSSDPLFDHTVMAEGIMFIEEDLGTWIQDEYDPCDTYSSDPYLGHGAGVCAEDTAAVIFTDCTFSENEAAVGGGIHFADANPIISDCNFTFNSAFHGGGLFGELGPVSIIGCNFVNNEAVSGPNVVILGEGGGLHLWATEADIIDCNIRSNQAEASGGGAYFGGEGTSSLTNCLLTNNTAGRDGAGVSTNIFSQLTISNCTIADNIVTGIGFGGTASYGGGLYCSYESNTDIIDSIIWGNSASAGSQLAIGTGFEYDPAPSVVNVTYSDIGQPEAVAAIGDVLPVIRPGFDADEMVRRSAADDPPLAYLDDGSTGLVDIGFNINFFGNMYNSLYVNINGNVTFDANMAIFTPFGLTGPIGTSIIASFFADVDTGGVDVNDPSNQSRFVSYGRGTVDGHNTFGVNWVNVGYYSDHVDKLNTFQLILIERSDRSPGSFDIEFNYEGIEWETGDASGGVDGFGGESARVGFSNGTGEAGTFYEFEGSGVNGAFLDTSPSGLIYDSHNSTVDGRYIFPVVGGIPEIAYGVPIYVEDGCILNGETIYDWDPNDFTWDPTSHNIMEDPNFIAGYYLSQIAAGQLFDSPCVDTGSADANDPSIGLDTYTTRTDGVFDCYDPIDPNCSDNPISAQVDMGYHYSYGLTRYQLTVTVVGDHGTVEPTSGMFYEGDVVLLTATPQSEDPKYRVKKWTGTDDDTSTELQNTVTMTEDKTVTVEFELIPMFRLTTSVIGGNGLIVPNHPSPGVLYFDGTEILLFATPDPGYGVYTWNGTDDDSTRELTNTVTISGSDAHVTVEFKLIGLGNITINGDPDNWFFTIQDAIDAAQAFDEVVISDGLYSGPGNYDLHFNGIPITVRSENGPENCIIDCNGAGRGFIFGAVALDPTGILDINNIEDPNYIVRGLTIQNGSADFGGGLYYESFTFEAGEAAAIFPAPLVENCIIRNCNATSGGGVAFNVIVVTDPGAELPEEPPVPVINNCKITGNTTSLGYGANGGGIFCTGGIAPIITTTEVSHNEGYFGGGIYCEAGSAMEIINCLIIYNSSVDIGGSIYLFGSDAIINLCTIMYNTGLNYEENDYGLPIPIGGVACRDASPTITNCIIGRNGSTNPYYGTWGDVLTFGDDLYECEATFSCIENADEGEGNISDNPLFTTGGLGDFDHHFYLPQVQSGQGIDSPCIDAGEQYALAILQGPPPDGYNLGFVTTSVINDIDIGYTDMGFHYPFYDGPAVVYRLVINVTGEGSVKYRVVGTDIIGDLNSATSPIYFDLLPGTLVHLYDAKTDPSRWGYWSGTDDDTSFNTYNYVTMSDHKTVTVSFELIVHDKLYVPEEYPLLQSAIDAAKFGDTIILAPTGSDNPYRTSMGYAIQNKKAITITSEYPDDPSCVAATVIEMQPTDVGGWVNTAFRFSNVDERTVLDGLTIRGFNLEGVDGIDGLIAGDPGTNGASVFGGAILCMWDASPTIKNCIITDCSVTSGSGGNGASGTTQGGHGGWPGKGYGGGMACLYNSNPTVINCTFENCAAVGGSGGNGGDADPDGVKGGRGGAWFYGENSYWYDVTWPYAYHGYYPTIGLGDGFYDFYTEYTGRGGAVFVGEDCSPTFTDCTFTNNQTEGGTCGICGLDMPPGQREQPGLSWEIDNFGGAVYCDSNSLVKFKNCTFNDNIADTNKPTLDPDDPDSYGNDDDFVGFGGAVAFKYKADVAFDNCTFNGNLGDIGGAMYWAHSDPLIDECEFTLNSASSGGGILFVGGSGEIVRSSFSENEATGQFAHGGGICSLGSNAGIIDCNISNNDSSGSGGGIYISSRDIDGDDLGWSNLLVENCLIVENSAGRDGGGISANWGSEPNIVNCTIADNTVTGTGFDTGYGGGLYSCYGNYTYIIDSILWGNSAENGQQIAIGTSYKPATVEVYYSDIQGGPTAVWVDDDCTLLWDVEPSHPDYPTNIDKDPLFATGPLGGYYLSQTDANSASYPGQDDDSPCVDAGSDLASHLEMNRYTTRTDNGFDKGKVDMGYHYPLPEIAQPCRLCDLVYDGIINFKDFAIFALNWLSEGCSDANDWCEGADFTFDTYVDFEDLDIFVGCWLFEDTEAPIPNPSEWEIEPYSMSTIPPYSISMTAKTAVDAWGWDVEYYFQRTDANGNPDGSFRDWDLNSAYIDDGNGLGLDPNTKYGYRVKAHDELGNETEWSVIRYARAGVRVAEPPTWLPYVATPNSITVEVTTSDSNGIAYEEYRFWNTTLDVYREWLDDPTWTNTGLDPNTTYTYRVRAIDENGETTDWSDPCSATTSAPGEEDTTPPTPDSATWETEPYATSFTSILMVATTAEDLSGVVEYYFDCTSHPEYSSNPDPDIYQDSPIYSVTGLPEGMYTFVVRVRDAYLNTTGDSDPPITVDLEPPDPAHPMLWAADGEPEEIWGGPGDLYYAQMTAEVATDPSGVQYNFICTAEPGLSSGWQSSPTYTILVGASGQALEFYVIAHDLSPIQNETDPSSTVAAILVTPGP